jgi:hypothetical protein
MEENDNDDMEMNDHSDTNHLPVPVSSTSSLDSFCLATADLMQECNSDDLHYNAAMDVSSNVEVPDSSNGTSESLTNNSTKQLPNMPGSIISPGTAGAQLKSALLPPSMSLPQQQQQPQPATTNKYHPLIVAPPHITMSLSGTPAPPLGIGQHQQPSAQQLLLMQPAAPPPPPSLSGTLVSVVSGTTNTSVPEFLFQLTRMLSDDNRKVIEWSNGTYRGHVSGWYTTRIYTKPYISIFNTILLHETGKIEVHSPHKLESDVLHKYYRHSKFASFQRQ